MAPNDPWKRYLDAGLELTALTRQRAEKVVRDLMKAGELQRDEVQDRVDELLERSRRTTEAVVEIVRDEVAKQLSALGLTTSRSRERSDGAPTSAGRAAPAPANAAASAAKSAAKKSTGTAKKAAKNRTSAAKTATKKAATTAKSAKKTAGKAAGATKKASGAS